MTARRRRPNSLAYGEITNPLLHLTSLARSHRLEKRPFGRPFGRRMGIGSSGRAHKLMQLGRALQRRRRRLDGGLKRAYKACRSGIGIGPPPSQNELHFPPALLHLRLDGLVVAKASKVAEGSGGRKPLLDIILLLVLRPTQSASSSFVVDDDAGISLSLFPPPSFRGHSPVSSSFRACVPRN